MARFSAAKVVKLRAHKALVIKCVEFIVFYPVDL
jgi:hypothetical protein